MDNIDLPDAVENNSSNETVELVQFHKWLVIIPELKNHAISYFDGQTQFNYSQCSQLCNQEMQRFDNRALKTITLSGGRDENQSDIVVEMRYGDQSHRYDKIQAKFVDVGGNQHKWTVQPETTKTIEADENRVYQNCAMDGALAYLERRCITLEGNLTCSLTVSTPSWPVEFNNFFLQRCCKCFWAVDLTESSLDDFMSFVVNLPDGMEMIIQAADYRMSIPSELGQTRAFLGSNLFDCHQPIEVTDEQFLQCKAPFLQLLCKTISDQAIHQKIQYYLDNPQEEGVNLYIFIYDGSREIDASVIFGDLDVHRESDDEEDGKCFTLSKMNRSISIRIEDNAITID